MNFNGFPKINVHGLLGEKYNQASNVAVARTYRHAITNNYSLIK